jgi:hypothetical protein
VSGFYDLTHSIRQADFQFRKEKKNLKKNLVLFFFSQKRQIRIGQGNKFCFSFFFDSKIFIPLLFI